MRNWKETPAWVYYCCGVLLIGIALYNMPAWLQQAQDRKLALETGPPEAVSLDYFSPPHHMNAANEVNISVQADTENIYRASYVVNSGKSRSTRHLSYSFARPLSDYQETAPAQMVIVGHSCNPSRFAHTLENRFQTHKNAYGRPVLNVNGLVVNASKYRDKIYAAAAEQGISLSEDAIFVEAFIDGRKHGLRDKNTNIFIYGMIGLGFVMCGFGMFKDEFIYTSSSV